MEKYKRIWTQVSDAFADYSDYLVLNRKMKNWAGKAFGTAGAAPRKDGLL